MANEMRLIDADALVENFRKTKMDEVFPEWKELGVVARTAVIRLTTKYRAIILSQPTVDAKPVVHGYWEEDESSGYYRCNRCKDVYIAKEWIEHGKWKYCPNCGAKMDGGNEDVLLRTVR